jgi:hypothetical protein
MSAGQALRGHSGVESLDLDQWNSTDDMRKLTSMPLY